MPVYLPMALLMFDGWSYQCVFPGEDSMTRILAVKSYPQRDHLTIRLKSHSLQIAQLIAYLIITACCSACPGSG